MLTKPESCQSCSLFSLGQGYIPADGAATSPILLVGESGGATEAHTGRPFTGDAGSMLQRLLNLLGWDRPTLRIDNCIRCFPGDTLLGARGIQRGYRRWYVGEMVTAVTREGVLTGTPNHPVLTGRGWAPLGELHEGDYLICGTFQIEGMFGGDPDVEHRPAAFSEVFDALTTLGRRRRVVGADVDFHGDGLDSEIDVVTADGVLGIDAEAAIAQSRVQFTLTTPDSGLGLGSGTHSSLLTTADLYRTEPSPSRRLVGGRREGRTPLRIQPLPARTLTGRTTAGSQTVVEDRRSRSIPFDAVRPSERLQTFPCPIATAEILSIKRTRFSGHVYNLQTASEQYIANGFIVHNCHPPNDWLDGAPWQYTALDHCSQYLNDSLASPYLKVVVPMGGTALKRVLGLSGKRIKVQDFHGTISRDPLDRFWVVPTFHPSFLQRGAHNLIGTVVWDLQQAQQAALHGKAADPASLVIDPPFEWFRAWVDQFLAAARSDEGAYPLTVDVETPDKAHGKDEGEITAEDRSFQILRVNLACHTDEGITVPFAGPLIEELLRLFSGCLFPLWMFNKEYDVPRLIAAGVLPAPTADRRTLDLMWLWHYLQSDLPRGLGFVAPFYSAYGPWKHLADSEPALYGAVDGLQNHRVGFGVIGDLKKLGMLDGALRHVHQLHHQILKPAQVVGVKIDRERLTIFKADLTQKAERLLHTLESTFPESLRNLTPKGGLTKPPAAAILHVKATAFTRKGTARKGKPVPEIKQELYKRAVVVERTVEKDVFCCRTCGAVDVPRRHRCQDRTLIPDPVLQSRSLARWFWSEPFNPDSWQQVLAYIKFRKHAPGKAKKTHKETTDRETLERLQRTGDPFYASLLDYRAVNKVKGTYVDGTERRLDAEDRVHPEPTFKPSTMRLSYVNPNITNVIQDRGGKESLAAGFRRCVVASPSCRLLEVDFAGSEQVDVGWFSRGPNHIRLAKLGIHAGLASHVLKRPYDPKWSEEELGAYFKAIKKSPQGSIEQITYDRSKRFVHGFSYGLTIPGMVLQFPELFPTRKVAEEYAEIFRHMAPKIPAWQRSVRERAFKQHYLGGVGDHPFGYKHWFWSVYTYKKINSGQYWAILNACRRKGIEEAEAPVAVINGQYFKVGLGEDGKRAVAFYPQSTTAGKLKEAALRLFDPAIQTSYIGDTYFGRTPLRAPIHDSLLLEVPDRRWDRVLEAVCTEMQRPLEQMPCPAEWGLGPYLSTGISAKAGHDWTEMEDVSLAYGVGTDTVTTAAEIEEEEEVADLGRSVA